MHHWSEYQSNSLPWFCQYWNLSIQQHYCEIWLYSNCFSKHCFFKCFTFSMSGGINSCQIINALTKGISLSCVFIFLGQYRLYYNDRIGWAGCSGPLAKTWLLPWRHMWPSSKPTRRTWWRWQQLHLIGGSWSCTWWFNMLDCEALGSCFSHPWSWQAVVQPNVSQTRLLHRLWMTPPTGPKLTAFSIIGYDDSSDL